MCNAINLLDEAESRACIIWVIGEYSHLIDNANELLELFIDSYHDEKPYVQLQLLTAAVKLFLKCHEKGKDLVTTILTLATAETLSVDIRDRAFLYTSSNQFNSIDIGDYYQVLLRWLNELFYLPNQK